jgi:hypothetical protein
MWHGLPARENTANMAVPRGFFARESDENGTLVFRLFQVRIRRRSRLMDHDRKIREYERTPRQPDRRAFGKAVLAGILGGPAVLSSVARAKEDRPPSDSEGQGMKLALMLRPENQERWVLARQIGVNHAIVPLSRVLDKVTREKYLYTLTNIKATYEASGLSIAGVESHPVAAEKIKLGLPGRDEEIANYCAVIEALGKVGIPMCCYNFMAEMLKLYHDVGFRGPIRPDHAPTLADESNRRPGYAMQGKVFAIGYMKGIAQTLNIPVM